MSFDRETPVFQLAFPPRKRYRPVLLPVWVHQVTAPTGYSRTLDVFQTVVLRLCAAGVRDVGDLSRLIGLDTALCRTVIARLVEGRLMEPGLKLTEAGRRTVAEGEVAETDPQLVRVFQDPATGVLLPRILVADPVRADVREHRGRWVTIQFGTAGASREVGALTLRAGGSSLRPSERDVLEACKNHDLAARGLRGGSRGTPDGVVAARRIGFHGTAIAAYVVCYVVEDDDGSGRMWTVEDPFAVGDGRYLADLLVARAESDEPLGRLIDGLLGGSRRDRTATARRVDQELAEEARADVVRMLGEEIRDHPEVLAHLADIELALLKDTARERENAARNAIRVFECILPGLNDRFPARLPPSREPGVRERAFVLTAQRLGATSVPPEMRRYCKAPANGLAGDIIKAVWAAGENPQHPFVTFIRRRPTLLEDLDRSRILRNNATHGPTGAPAPDELEHIRTLAYEAARHLLGLSGGRSTDSEKVN
ncbi:MULTISPECIES: hypothetical protein [Streptomyces]|uniref:Uncharacterized protein n=1 Tax=Streptomyces rochei TaxID=1928 RepID=A0AAX3ZU12_STRRO|nr:hypothetical protein [Streptomyces rochei]WMC89792.1 hypothetical protein P7W03_31195 [Streptomyces rochei]